MKRDYHSLIAQSALIACTGYLLSGPAGFVAVHFIKPQPAWHSSAMFAANYHFVQDIPYYFGLLLIGGMMMLSAAHYLQVQEDHARSKIAELVSLMFTVVFATLIFFNYICQTTFVRHLALHYKPSNDAVIAAFSMSNPMSLSWAVEMWGYGFLGVATWLLAEYYRNRNALIRYLLIGNGIMSVAGVVLTVTDNSWVLTKTGLAAYLLWNALMIVLMILIFRYARKQVQQGKVGRLNNSN